MPVREEAWTHTSRWTEYCRSLIVHRQTRPGGGEGGGAAARACACAALCCRDVQNSPGSARGPPVLPPVSPNRRGREESLSVRLPNQRADAT